MATSPLSAPNLTRERLAPPALVIGLALGILLTLALLFNPESFLARIKHSHMPAIDFYFVSAVAHGSHDTGLHLLLAKREIETGHYKTALAAIKTMLKAPASSSFEDRARWLYYSDLLATTYTYRPGSAVRLQNERHLKLLISQLQSHAHGNDLAGLAREAIALREGRAAIAIYKDLAAQNPRERPEFFALAGAAALGLGHPRESAQLYFAAQDAALLPAEQSHYFLTALHILQSHHNVVLAVYEAGRHLGHLGHNPYVLRQLITLSQAANEPQVAAHYATLLVQI